MSEKASGVLEVGTNEGHEVVINLPHDMTGHIVFSPQQARSLADSLIRKAHDAERAHREASEAARIASAPPVDRSALCTTNGKPPEEVRRNQTNETGQHDGYLVLCEDERKKGFVRPYRDAYKHVGRRVCGKPRELLNDPRPLPVVCTDEPGHPGDCTVWAPVESDAALARARDSHVLGGCGSVTRMGRALSETYARDPTFYGATFCVACNQHLPVAEFVWTLDGARVGS